MDTPGALIASGRDADIFECGVGRVLRRSRNGRSMVTEARTMEFVRAHGYPVPEVYDVSDDGLDLVLERIEGPTMVDALASLPSPSKDILRTVAARRGAIPVEDVGVELGLATRGGHWNAGVSMLRTNNLIAITPRGFELGSALSVAPCR